MTRTLLLMPLFASLALAGCGDSADSEAVIAPVASVRVEAAGNHTVQSTVSAFGTATFPPENLHSVVASAEVRVVSVLVSAGEPVHRDQVLMVVAPTANTNLEQVKARADLNFTRQDLARVSALRKQALATNADVATAELANANARAVLEGIQARVGNSSGELKAERDGLIASVDAQQGDIETAGASLLHLADSADLRVRLGIEPKDLSGVHEGQTVELTAIYDVAIKVKGHIGKLISQIDPTSRLAEARVDIEAGSPLLPGAMVKANILLDAGPDAIAVPRSAVLQQDQRDYLFIIRDGKAVRTWVETGKENDTFVQIRSGVTVGEPVVVEGNYELSDGMAVKVEAATQ